MKYLVLLVVLVVAYMMWRNSRLEQRRDAPPPPPPAPAPAIAPQEMVSCPVCGLHLPKSDAVPGKNGLLYCGPEHRLLAGG